MKKIVPLALLTLALSTTAQTNKADSLFTQLKKWENKTGIVADTNLYNIYYDLGDRFLYSNPDTALHFYNKSIVYAKKQQDELKEGKSIIQQGSCFYLKSNYEKALQHHHQALTIAEKNSKLPTKKEKAQKLQAAALGNIGVVYMSQGDYSKALDYYFNSLKMQEETGNKNGQAANLGNIGNIYHGQGDNFKALDYYFKALKISEEILDKKSQAVNLGNIGSVYQNQGDYSKALVYHFKALKIYEEIGSKKGQALNLGNIGIDYRNQGDNFKALEYYFKALKINEEIGNKQGQTLNLGNIGSFYLQQKKYKEADTYLSKAIQLGEEIGIPYYLKIFYNTQSELYTQTNKHQEALEAYKKHIMYRDSVMSEENQKVAVQKEMQFEFDKKEALAKAEQDKKDALAKEELEKQTMQRNGFIGGFILMLALAGVVFRSYRNKQKANVIIIQQKHEVEQQKHIIEEKHKEITDSINYAERIQRSFLATTEMLDEYLNDYFVFFRPKDVVSGDFYWAAKLNNDNFAFACADSTGHGVPGAIMSILNISSLEKSIETQTEPHKILHETRKIIINRLKKDGSAEGGKDGMDCSLLVLNQEKNHLTFASANNSVFIIRNGEILEFKGDKMPVGKHDNADEIFTLHSVDLQKGDVIYSLTDGFPDQFGGNKGKKYMIKNLKNLLLEITLLPLKEQEEKLANEFDNWKGSEEQVDDVCIIGVRV